MFYCKLDATKPTPLIYYFTILLTITKKNVLLAYEYVPDSEITDQTLQSRSEEDLLEEKVVLLFIYTIADKFQLQLTLSTIQTLSIEELTECAPRIVKKLPKVVRPKDNEVVKLEVKVEGKPTPEVKWFKQGEELHSSEEYQIEQFEDGTSVLFINNVYEDDTGEITFEAHNPLGVAVTTTELSVEGTISNNCMSIKFSSFIAKEYYQIYFITVFIVNDLYRHLSIPILLLCYILLLCVSYHPIYLYLYKTNTIHKHHITTYILHKNAPVDKMPSNVGNFPHIPFLCNCRNRWN